MARAEAITAVADPVVGLAAAITAAAAQVVVPAADTTVAEVRADTVITACSRTFTRRSESSRLGCITTAVVATTVVADRAERSTTSHTAPTARPTVPQVDRLAVQAVDPAVATTAAVDQVAVRAAAFT